MGDLEDAAALQNELLYDEPNRYMEQVYPDSIDYLHIISYRCKYGIHHLQMAYIQ